MINVLAASNTVPDIITFAVAAVLVLGGAAGVIVSRNPVHAALCLVTTLFGIAVLFVQQGAHFLAAVQVIVYAGAIVVLFLFVIMLLGVDKQEATSRDRFKSWRPFVAVLGLAVGALVVGLAKWDWQATGARSLGGTSNSEGTNIETLANSIFTQYLLAFESTSLLLVIAVIGAVVLARRPSYEADLLDDDVIITEDAAETEAESAQQSAEVAK